MNINRVTVCIGVLLCLAASPVAAMESQQASNGFDEGMAAYKRADYTTALEKWRPLAEKGDPAAQRQLGLIYEYGKGVKQDFKLAAGWYRKAADQGMAEAQILLGMLYRDGKGMARDEEQAFKWFHEAAGQGTAAAQLFLASQYVKRFDAKGQAEDAVRAAEWNRKAATQGDANGLLRLAWHYDKGIGVARNLVLAYMMLNLADDRNATGAASYRDEITRAMTLAQVLEAKQLAAAWKAGTPLPAHTNTWETGAR